MNFHFLLMILKSSINCFTAAWAILAHQTPDIQSPNLDSLVTHAELWRATMNKLKELSLFETLGKRRFFWVVSQSMEPTLLCIFDYCIVRLWVVSKHLILPSVLLFLGVSNMIVFPFLFLLLVFSKLLYYYLVE